MNTCFTALCIFPLDSDERKKGRRRRRRRRKENRERGVCLVCTYTFDHVAIVS